MPAPILSVTFGAPETALFGYNGNPSLTEVLAYAAYFLALFTSLWAAGQRRPLPAPVSD